MGVFKPKNGIREKLRETLQTVLKEEMAERAKEVDEPEASTIAPLSTPTISGKTRYVGEAQTEHPHERLYLYHLAWQPTTRV